MSVALNEEYHRAIGRLVVIAGEIESILIDLTSIFLMTDIGRALIVSGHQQAANKADTLLALMRFSFGDRNTTDPSEYAAIYALIERAKNFADYRNTIVHTYWSIDEDGTVSSVRFQARGVFKRTKKPVSHREIDARALEGDHLLSELRALRATMQQTPPQGRQPLG